MGKTMASIPFTKDMEFEYGRVDMIAPGVRRVIAENPGPFTFTGTGVYILGEGEVAIIDPGPVLPAHINALKAALKGERVAAIFITHHHLDHTPLARPLAEEHGCPIYGYGQPLREEHTGESDVRLEAGDDVGFRPDVELKDGDVVNGEGWSLRALHTPGHTSNHMCYAFDQEQILFCGDHVMAWSTSVVSPPDGDMGDYLDSLERIRDMGFAQLWPAHGPAVMDPDNYIAAYIAHRRHREAQILVQLEAGHTRIRDMVTAMYVDVDKRLHPAAAHSVLAHMAHLVKQGRVTCEGEPGLASEYTLNEPALVN